MFTSRNPYSLVRKTVSAVAKAAVPVCAVAALSFNMTGCGAKEGEDRNSQHAAEKQTLVAGDMLNHMQSLLVAANENTPADYTLNWANFVAGPAIIAAATGGSVDVSWMAETPLVFAQAAGSPVTVIAASVPVVRGAPSIAIAVPNDSPIQSFADLKGKKVFHLPGTILQYVLVEHLEQAGLNLKDVHTVSATTGTGAGPQMLVSGAVDAAVLVEPAITLAEQNPNIRILPTTLERLHGGTRLVVVPTKILEDEQARLLIADFLQRISRAYQWQQDNYEAAVKQTAALYKLPVEQADGLLRRSLSQFVPINDEVIASLQRQADTFTKLGIVRKELDMSQIFDTRFNYLFEGKVTAENATEATHQQVGALSQDDISN